MARHPRGDSAEAEEGFVSRWSRRKQQERDSGAGPDPAADNEPPGSNVQPMPAPEAETEQPVKGDADMPPLESINESSSVSDFFSPGVTEQLRKMALRKLFQGAKFNIRDGLDDYDDDFRNFEALGDIVTSDMRHQQELAEARARTEQADGVEPGMRAEVTPDGPDTQAEQHPVADDGANPDTGGADTAETAPDGTGSAAKRVSSADAESEQDKTET